MPFVQLTHESSLSHAAGNYPAHIVSIAFTLLLSGTFADSGAASTEGKVDAGNALLIIGLWVSWLVVFEDTLGKLQGVVSKLVAPPINIVALVAVLLNLLGCILLWAAADGKLYPGLGTVGFVSGCLFVAAWWLQGPISLWVGFFWFASFQYQALSISVNGCGARGGSDEDACKAGGVFQWLGSASWR